MRPRPAILALLAAVVALPACGEEPDPRPEAEQPAAREAASRPEPAAAGPYLHESPEIKVNLFLYEDGTFRLVTTAKAAQVTRTASGLWTLRGPDLELTYLVVNGERLEQPDVTRNAYRPGRVALGTGKGGPTYVLERWHAVTVR
jgi:hypothetical protein